MRKSRVILLLLLSLLLSLAVAGCGKKEQATDGQAAGVLPTVTLGHVGAVCEAPLFVAYELGYFKAKGINVVLYRIPDDANKQVILATDKVDVTDGVLQTWLKALEAGVDIKFTGGTHTGCLSIIALPNSSINSVKDLKGKTVAVTGANGGGAMNYAYRALIKAGLDPAKDVTWKAYPQALLITALQKGQADAAVGGDTLDYTWRDQGQAKIIASMAKDPGFSNEICCLIAFNSGFIAKHPDEARAITEAINEATLWVKQNPGQAAKIMVDKQYILGTVPLNTELLKSYDWDPSLAMAKEALSTSAKEFKAAGILGPDADIQNYVSRYFVNLPGLATE